MIRYNGIEINQEKFTISNKGATVYFRDGKKFTFFKLAKELILSNGRDVHELFELFYGDDEDGGPITHTNLIEVRLVHLMRKIEPLNLQLNSERRGGERYKRRWITPRVL